MLQYAQRVGHRNPVDVRSLGREKRGASWGSDQDEEKLNLYMGH
jgi:hypothetical protein